MMITSSNLFYILIILLLNLANKQQQTYAATCGRPDEIIDNGLVVLNQCITRSFQPTIGSSKTITVFFTTTSGTNNDLNEIDNDNDGDNDYVQQVLQWIIDTWTQFTRAGYPDPLTLTDFIILIHIQADDVFRSSCCKDNRSMAIDPIVLQRNPDFMHGSTIHQFFHAVIFSNSHGDWFNEGLASWASYHVRAAQFDVTTLSLYVNEVNEYFALEYERSLLDLTFIASIFWTYYSEQLASISSIPSPNSSDDLITVMGSFLNISSFTGINVLQRLETFLNNLPIETIFANFGTANYIHTLTSYPALQANQVSQFQYRDSARLQGERGIGYPDILPNLDIILDNGEHTPYEEVTMPSWSNRYFVVRPTTNVNSVKFSFLQTIGFSATYTILAITNDALVFFRRTQDEFDLIETIQNDGYDEIVIIVSSHEQGFSFRYAFSAIDTTLSIVDPVSPTFAGDPAAPRQILAKVSYINRLPDTLEPVGRPPRGLQASDFSIFVGTESVPVSNIVTVSFVLGTYWIVFRPPIQSSSVIGNLLDLRIETTEASTIRQKIIRYGLVSPSDNIVVIDRSDSMNQNGRLESAKTAASVFIDSYRTGDQVGVVSFNETSIVDTQLSSFITNRLASLNSIDGLVASGGTSLGAALLAALNELDQRGAFDHEWNIVLLSDGANVDAPPISDFESAWISRRDGGADCNLSSTLGCLPKVHTIAIGSRDIDRQELRDLSDLTGGFFFFVPDRVIIQPTATPTPVPVELPSTAPPSFTPTFEPSSTFFPKTTSPAPSSTPSFIPTSTFIPTPGATAGATPGATMGATPGATIGATPGATMGATPGATMGATPGATLGATPGATLGATVGATTFSPVPTISPAPFSFIQRSLQALITGQEAFELELTRIYRNINEGIEGMNNIFSVTEALPCSSTDNSALFVNEHQFNIPTATPEAIIVFVWNDGDIVVPVVDLADPNGFVQAPDDTFRSHFIWKLSSPLSGTWTMTVFADESFCDSGLFYLVDVAASVDLFFAAAAGTVDLTQSSTAAEVSFVTVLTEGASPLLNQEVTASVDLPDGTSELVTLRDDGNSNDGEANDGVYGSEIRASQSGNVAALVEVDGTSTQLGSFETSKSVAAVVPVETDSDGDGIPDSWEDKYASCGMDKDNPDDASEDFDEDGLANFNEYQLRTNPCKSDSDGGGEGDGSEVIAGNNPGSSIDDAVPCLTSFIVSNRFFQRDAAIHCQTARACILEYTPDSAYGRIQVFRSTTLRGSFRLLNNDRNYNAALFEDISGTFRDELVTLGQQYCYQMQGITRDGRQSCLLGPVCTIPSNDPLCLQSLLINGGQEETDSAAVVINVQATGANRMRFSTKPSLTDAEWEPFAESKAFTLDNSNNPDEGTVFAQFEGFDGTTIPASASIRFASDVVEEECIFQSDENRCDLLGIFPLYSLNANLFGICIPICIPSFLRFIFALIGFGCGGCS